MSFRCCAAEHQQDETRKNVNLKWKSRKVGLWKRNVFDSNFVYSVCSHEKHVWNAGTEIQPLKFPEAGILLWNLLLNSFLFDLASYRLWYFPLWVNCILKIVFVLFLSSFTSLSVHIIVNYIRWLPMPPKFFSLLFDFALFSLHWLPFLDTFPQMWHKQKKKKKVRIIKSFQWAQDKRGAWTLSSIDPFQLMQSIMVSKM